MPIAFVTGGTGFIGGHLLRKLAGRGYQIKALVRPSTPCDHLGSLPVEVVRGDLREFEKVQETLRGCDVLYHAAADYRLWVRNPREMYESNVDGTRKILQAAMDFGIPKIVYTSTVGTIGLQERGVPADETSFLELDRRTGHYKKSKFMAEQVAFDFVKKGQPIVIVNPSAPVGSHDWKPTPTGRMIVDFLNHRMPMYLDTGLNLVDAEDVAEGHLLAATHGRHGERYILGNENLTLKQILEILSELSGIPAPRVKCPYALALGSAWISEGMTRLTGGREPRVPLEGVYMARKLMFFDSRKARNELHFRPGTVQNALRKAILWFLENGYVKKPLAPEQLSFLRREMKPPDSLIRIDSSAVAMAK
jgi:dihydroflavonol-4-reductase